MDRGSGTSWDEECGKIILWKAVSIATFKPPAKNPECEIDNTLYLKVVGIYIDMGFDNST